MADLAAAKKALDKAKIQFMNGANTAFWTSIAFSMHHKFDESVKTAQTDGKTIWYNPDYFLSLTPKEQLFLLAHETSHVAFDHMSRMKERQGKRWNYATDYVINAMWIDLGYTMPKGGLYEPKYANMTADKVYAALPDMPDDPNQGGGTDPDSHMVPADPMDDDHSQHIQDLLVRAQIASEMAGDKPGSIPGELLFQIEEMTKAQLPTKTLLQRYMNKRTRGGRNWSRPNKRYSDVYLPQRRTKKLGHVAIAIDSSCSVSDKDFATFIGEIHSVLMDCRPELISLITFDTQIQAVDEIRTESELLNMSFKGRGGTSIEPVMAWSRKHRPLCMMVFTDGGFDWASEEDDDPNTDYLWLIHDNERWEPKHGTVIHYESDQ